MSNITLNNNWNWDPTYAFGGGFPIFGSTSKVTGLPSNWYSDPYSKVFYLNSNSYGSGYSDNLMKLFQVGGPQLTVGTNPPAGIAPGPSQPDVGAINLTIFADNETPTGYATPQLYSYIAPTGGKFTTPDNHTAGASIGMNFALGAASNGAGSLVLDQSKAQISFKYLDGYTGATPIFDAHPLVMNLANSGTLQSLWQNWWVVAPGGALPNNAGTNTNNYYIVAPTGQALTEGNLLLLNSLPVATNGTSWYKVQVDAKDGSVPAKVFNLYTETTGGQFVNTPGGEAIDGGATIAQQQNGKATSPTFNINFVSGSSTSIDGSLLGPTTSTPTPATAGTYVPPTKGIPWSPVAGTIATGGTPGTVGVYVDPTTQAATKFTAPTGPNLALGATTTETVASTSVAFSWTGAVAGQPAQPTYSSNGGVSGNGFDSTYTNKLLAGDVALISIYTNAQLTGTPVTTVSRPADLDGQWVTNNVTLQAATYYVVMQEFRAADTAFKSPVTNVSSVLTLTVSGGGGGGGEPAQTDIAGINTAPDLHQ